MFPITNQLLAEAGFMQPWQERVVQEKDELDDKLAKLIVFMSSTEYKTMKDWQEASRLKRQSQVMKEYLDILAASIAAFRD